MTFFPVPDELYSDPRFISLPDAALALWARAGSWSARHLTDGSVPSAMLPALMATTAAADALVAAGLWKRARGGYRYTDWPEHCSKAHVEAKREAARARKTRSRSSQDVVSRRDTRVTHAGQPRASHCSSNPVSQGTKKGGYASGEPHHARARDTGPLPDTPPATDPAQPPPARCPAHLHAEHPPACGRCADARRHRETWDRDQAAAARTANQARRAAILACPLCDHNGLRDELSGRVERCDHLPQLRAV